MADTHEEKGASVIPWIHELLLKFIKNYSKVVKALTQLTGNTAWTWGKPPRICLQRTEVQNG